MGKTARIYFNNGIHVDVNKNAVKTHPEFDNQGNNDYKNDIAVILLPDKVSLGHIEIGRSSEKDTKKHQFVGCQKPPKMCIQAFPLFLYKVNLQLPKSPSPVCSKTENPLNKKLCMIVMGQGNRITPGDSGSTE